MTHEGDDLARRVDPLPWFHEIDFGDGVRSPGATPSDVLHRQRDVCFEDGVAGRTVIHIGGREGFDIFPNRVCGTELLRDVDPTRAEFTRRPVHATREVFHAYE